MIFQESKSSDKVKMMRLILSSTCCVGTMALRSSNAPPAAPAVFAYGTLRGDFEVKEDGKTGDNWGVVDEKCDWQVAKEIFK